MPRKLSLCLLLCILLHGISQAADSVSTHVPKALPLAVCVQVGYVSELWAFSGELPGAFSTSSYVGKGSLVGIGITSKPTLGKRLRYGLNLCYLQYNMQENLLKNELLPTSYGFVRISPAGYFYLNPGAALQFHLSALVHILDPLDSKNKSYWQTGGHIGTRYKAYGLSIGYFAAPSNVGPAATNNRFREQSLQFTLSVYPSQINGWQKVKTALKNLN